jgi:hypothetical protein
MTAPETTQATIPAPISDGRPSPPPPPVRPDFVIQSTVFKKVDAVEPAPLAGMVPVAKEITITQHLVDDPRLADPVPPVHVTPNPEAVARMKALAALRPKRVFVQLSATVYDHQRTHLHWYYGGAPERRMEAWSSLDFTVFSGLYKVVRDGVEYELMSIGMGVENTAQRRRIAERFGKVYQPPVFPELPPVGTPAFVVTKGDAADTAALAPITALHELYKTDSARLIAEHEARLQAQREREAYIRAHPPEPQDVTIHFWEREHPVGMSADTIKKEEEKP